MVPPAKSAERAAPLLRKLCAFTGAPKEFWPLFLETAGVLTGAAAASLHVAGATQEGATAWQRLLDWRGPNGDRNGNPGEPVAGMLQSAMEGGAVEQGGDLPSVAFRVSAGAEGGAGVVFLGFTNGCDPASTRPAVCMLAEIPAQYLAVREVSAVRKRNEDLLGALDVSLLMDRQPRFLAAAMTVCNELGARLRCDRTSLGWLQDDDVIRLRAVSQSEKYEKKAEVVRLMEIAMEECLDQEAEIRFPATDATTVTREHAAYARETGAVHLLSLPISVDGKPVGVFLCERQSAPFDEGETGRIRLALDQAGRRLSEREERERWVGRRFWRWVKRQSGSLFKPQHTGTKIAAALGALVVLFLIIGRLPYKVSAPFVLRSDQVAFVTAPFDGFVQDVAVRVGDNVGTNDLLARFDTRELVLQQSGALANVSRHQQEAEKARAANDLPEMRIAQAQGEQAKAALEQTKYHIEKAEIRSPFPAAVVEGDLRKRIGSPFRQGEVLLQLARLDALYVEMEVAERDAHEILAAREAFIAFASAPEREFMVTIELVHPSAQSRPSGGVFLVRAKLPPEAQQWWRPGMSGAAKIKVGWRNPLWIMTHRTLDWLRLHWW